MKAIEVRNVKIGEGIPKICVPIVEVTEERIVSEARNLANIPADIVEWRADWFEAVSDTDSVNRVLKNLRKELKDIPLLFTFRTSNEGGERDIQPEEYVTVNIAAIKSGCADMVDVELFMGDAIVKRVIEEAHQENVKVVASNHDFQKTPDKEEIIARLCKMQELDADIPKIAVMPQNKADVLTLLSATEEMVRVHADRPVITMSMAGTGVVSRLCGEMFGSSMTFGAGNKTSAPGQIKADALREVLQLLHENV